MRITKTMVAFYGRYDWPSTFFRCEFTLNDVLYNSVEKAFNHLMAIHFDDQRQAGRILRSDNPSLCKIVGKRIKGFDDEEWKKVRDGIMDKAIEAKYRDNPYLAMRLTDTDDKLLVEASPDLYWGCGLSGFDDRILDSTKWLGKNQFGVRTMYHRTALQAEIAKLSSEEETMV